MAAESSFSKTFVSNSGSGPMSESPSGGKSPYKFENDLSGRLFVWCIESGRIDLAALVDHLGQEEPDQEKLVGRLATALEQTVAKYPNWASAGPRPSSPGPQPATQRKAPAYSIWFRPSPSKKIRFKEVAAALLVFAGRLPPPGTGS
jgi:hypothetical protein